MSICMTGIEEKFEEMIIAYNSLGFSLDKETVLERLKRVIEISNQKKSINIGMDKLIKIAIEIEIIVQIKCKQDIELQNRFLLLYRDFIKGIAHNSLADVNINMYNELHSYLYSETIRCIYKFDPNSGHAFSTYAKAILNHLAKRYIDKHLTQFKVSHETSEISRRISQKRNSFYRQNGYYPSFEQILETEKYSRTAVTAAYCLQNTRYCSLQQSVIGSDGVTSEVHLEALIANPNQKTIEQETEGTTFFFGIEQIFSSILNQEEIEIFVEYCSAKFKGTEELNRHLNEKYQTNRSRQALEQQLNRILYKVRYQIHKGNKDFVEYFKPYITSRTPQYSTLYEISHMHSEGKTSSPRTITPEEIEKLSAFFNKASQSRRIEKMTDEEKLIIGLKLGIIGGKPLTSIEIEEVTGIRRELCVAVCDEFNISINYVNVNKKLLPQFN